MVAACRVVRSLRSLVPERISPVAVFSEREVSLELQHDVVELVGHRVGVGLEPREGAFVLALHPLGEIGLGQRRQHLAGLVEAAIDRRHQVVDAAGDAVEFDIGELGVDALREVAGHRRVHHLAEGLLQLGHHPGALLLVADDARRLGLGHLGDLEPVLRGRPRPPSPCRRSRRGGCRAAPRSRSRRRRSGAWPRSSGSPAGRSNCRAERRRRARGPEPPARRSAACRAASWPRRGASIPAPPP